MDLDRLKQIVDWMASQPLQKVEISDENWSVCLVKSKSGAPTTLEPSGSTPAVHRSLHEEREEHQSTSRSASDTDTISAYFYGVLHLSPDPDSPPYVSVGDTVETGQSLCMIEAMKVFNTVTADRDGVITKILASDGEEVSAGQPLFQIES